MCGRAVVSCHLAAFVCFILSFLQYHAPESICLVARYSARLPDGPNRSCELSAVVYGMVQILGVGTHTVDIDCRCGE